MKVLVNSIIIIGLIAGFSGIVFSQNEPSSGRIEQELKDKKEPQPTMEKTVNVQKFVFSGNKLISTERLLSLVKSYEGKSMTFSELKKVANVVTAEYRKEKYTLAFAYLPEQEIKDGVVKIEIVEGKLAKVVVEGNKYYSEDFIRNYFDNFEKESFSEKELERSLLLLNDFANLSAKATARKGAASGETDLLISVEDKFPFKISIDFDNFGSENVSRDRWGTSIELGNLWNIGHSISFRGVVGTPVDDLKYGRLTYKFPLDSNGTKLALSYGKMDYDAGGDVSVLDLQGKGDMITLSLTHPCIKTRRTSLTADVSFDYKDIEQEILGNTESDDDLRILRVGVNWEHYDSWNGRTIVSTYIHKGLGTFLGGIKDDSNEASRLGADNTFTKFTINAYRVQKIVDWMFLIIRAAYQWANDTLYVSEGFGIGGPDSVRGYPNFEFLGDRGYNLSGELRVKPPVLRDIEIGTTKKLGDYLQFAFFYDHAKETLDEKPAGDTKGETLNGLGVGMRFAIPNNLSVRVDVGWPQGREPSDDDGAAIWYLQVVKQF